ncbi:LysM peptidoglycan-binding domain-containing protein [Endozoicomonas sp. GU-1]|uniref:lytic transglycosylase n=1 Tax=Endozoicomonas sp. GU-1 TaxID=3009078 RepID=UPI0022B50058|nr:LysM peptidoglycan-binding domain-containing protein [Endozoicomonas sp. GU-1]WBA79412.1 LysM peptidoglycan-binding domain-containing protein [Endozoicomonas sp. GU-1]WBA87056.1 LysM peptidoglycan-binding domain-containing protein [Endozoicomonas sp. GU-1]
MTKAPYLTGQQFTFGPPRRILPTLALSLFLTGCQLVSNSPSSSASTVKKETRPIVEKPSVEKVAVKTSEKITPEKKEPVVIDDLWVRIQSGLAMDLDQNNPRIQAELNWYKRHKSYFSQISKRSEPYLYFIVKEAEARNVPLELALMPIVESSFDPFAYSHAGASGLWQFMPATGKHYGLHQNWWYDGRRDVVHSTRAALDYMQTLYNRFGDWELALAAFNSGPGRVQRAVRKNKKLGKSTRFWALDLPRETTAYVPKLIALGKVVRNPSKHGVQLNKIPNKPYFAKVDTSGQLDMAKAAKLSGVELEELYRLNPGLNRWSTPPEGPHHLVVPVTHAEHFRTQLANLPPEKRVKWDRYTVSAGDTLSTIAMKYRTSVNVITEANKLSGTIIRIGQDLMIPVAAKTAESYTLSASQRLAAKQDRSVNGRYKVEYLVKSGDSFWTIAQKYQVGVNELARWNNMSPKDTLRINQKLVVWKKQDSQNAVVRKVHYKVRSGDSLAKIASKFNVNVAQIRDWNSDMSGKFIHPGQQVTLFVNVTRNF